MATILFFTFMPIFATVLGSTLLLNRYFANTRKAAMNSALRETRFVPVRPLLPLLLAPARTALSGLLARLNPMQQLTRWASQAGVSWPPGILLATIAGLSAGGVVLGLTFPVLLSPSFSAFSFALALGSVPFFALFSKRRKRLSEFEQQIPDALDFLARAMRAGHGFTTSLKIMADESPDPVGIEFRKLCAEHNLGASLGSSLDALIARVPLIDVRFFAAAVTLQRQTGGNLSEVFLKLSQVIRERFALRGKVKATSAHGRLTGLVLTAMPICLAVFLMVTSPDYLKLLGRDPLGKYLIAGAVIGQLIGYLFIRKIVDFEI